MKITHYLYNAFLVEEGDTRVAIDPGQNFYIFDFRSLIPEDEWPTVTHIVITHGDPDHHWQSDRVAEASGAPVVCGVGLTKTENGQTLVIDPRGRELTSWVPFESLHPLDVGDSLLLSDWNELQPTVLMIPIGGLGQNTWTMDVDDALQAVEQIDPEVVIPTHYNVPFLWKKKIAAADDQEFKRGVEALGKKCCVLGAGDSVAV